MECNEVLSVPASMVLLRGRREGRDGEKREGSGSSFLAKTNLKELPGIEVNPRSGIVSTAKPQDGISHIHPHPEVAFIQPESAANFDGYGYEDVSITSNFDAQKIMTSSPEKDSSRRWFHLCHCRRDLIAVKVFYFAFIGGIGVVLPYAAIFMKQLGLSPFQIGVISGIRPVLGFVSGPLWGSIADRFRIRRILMMISLLSWLAFYVGLYFVPAPAHLPSCPEKLVPHRGSLQMGESDPVLYMLDDNITFMGNNSVVYTNLTDADRNLLLENLSWLYESAGVYKVFLTCLLIICGGELFQAPTTALSDAATLQVLGRESLNQYGAQRAWGPLGFGLSSLLVGGILSSGRVTETICGIDVVFSDYRIIAYVFIGVMIVSISAALNIDFTTDANDRVTGEVETTTLKAKHSLLAVFKLFCNVHYGSWIFTTFYMGLCNGVIWGFLFWHLDNLGANQLLMGLDSIVACIFEFGAFFFVEHVIKYVGHIGILYIGLLAYIIRFVVYAALVNPWFVLPVEALQGLTFSFVWVSLTSYTASAVPTVSLATIQGVIHGVYFGLGNGLGHLFGGVMTGAFGAVITFNSFAVVSAVWLLLFIACQKLSKKPIDQFTYQDMEKHHNTNPTPIN